MKTSLENLHVDIRAERGTHYMYSLHVFADLCSLILSCTKNHTEISTCCNSR